MVEARQEASIAEVVLEAPEGQVSKAQGVLRKQVEATSGLRFSQTAAVQAICAVVHWEKMDENEDLVHRLRKCGQR